MRLPGSGQFLYPEVGSPSEKSLSELGLPHEGFYFVGQNPSKLHPCRDPIYGEISERTGKPIIICHHSSIPEAGEVVRERMARAGVNVQLLSRVSMDDFLRVAQLADAVLDSFDFSGGITTVQTLGAGIPLASCPGPFMRGRMSMPFLKQAAIEDLIASSEADFVNLVSDSGRMAAAREKIRPEGLFLDLRPVRALEKFLLGLQ